MIRYFMPHVFSILGMNTALISFWHELLCTILPNGFQLPRRTFPVPQRTFKASTKYVGNGHLLLGGALENPAGGALLVFVGETDAMAKAFAQEDPYVVNGLIKSWQVRQWNVVVGNK
ncbi:hypothetical protein [Galbibacter pacificus]|uniref:YCII-related domain-containing protein n=1 Tax=Galbibacter pacificus TaxID=2996052 RepID=A0ABT6FSN1_9FLAO|nr:hypothetical protein [Galbibacter pacificus]MDG3582616.1 hypothetical protein [Galbibacter pacificus]MDG3586265.1 hypothetical protein [Galbibacter pacificus]